MNSKLAYQVITMTEWEVELYSLRLEVGGTRRFGAGATGHVRVQVRSRHGETSHQRDAHKIFGELECRRLLPGFMAFIPLQQLAAAS